MLRYSSQIGATCISDNSVELAPGSCTSCSGSTCTTTTW